MCPVGNYPAPSQIAPLPETADDPFAEDDPFAAPVMAQMLADEPPPLHSPLRAAREELALLDEPAPVVETPAAAELVTEAPHSVEIAEEEPPMTLAEPAAKPAKTPRTPAAPRTNRGLTVARRYTKAGEDVFATTEYDLRTASIVGSDGTVVFEQKGVEIPKAWSQLATNVVVSKYFRGHVGTLEREYSVKQLIGRVADKILEWGRQGSYFATEEDASAFHDELRYILLHQYAAFNSPVWFNLGWPGRRQAVSACYINEVSDTMESILDLYKTEGCCSKTAAAPGSTSASCARPRRNLKPAASPAARSRL